MRHIIVGTAGHIDHGKSTLVLALTGTDPDRLKEEKARGITIDLGFAHLDLGDVQVGFVDVPGHERFIKNMLAGVGGIDLVLLVVAADESIMPQTREHFDICRLLGIGAGIVVITKTDLVEPEIVEIVRDEIKDVVRDSFLENAEIIPFSSKRGTGCEELKRAIHKVACSLPVRPTDRPLRLPIDRAFSIRGFGSVVTGTLTSGEIVADQEVTLIPGGLLTRVRGIQVHGHIQARAGAGQRTAVNLQGVELSQLERGLTLTAPGTFQASHLLDVHLVLLESARPLPQLAKVRFHQGTREVLARVALLGQEALSPSHTAFAQLRLDAPVLCLHGDAFIIRQFSPAITIGGGTVLIPNPAKHRSTDKDALSALRSLQTGTLDEKIPVLINAQIGRITNLTTLNSMLGLPRQRLEVACSNLAELGEVVVVPASDPILVSPPVIETLIAETINEVTRFHRENPLQKGVSREELRQRVYDGMPAEVFRFCLNQLVKGCKLSVQDDLIGIYGREVQLSKAELSLENAIENFYLKSGLQPPTLEELVSSIRGDSDDVRKVFYWMVKEKILIRISEGLAYHRLELEKIRKKLKEQFVPGTRIGVAQFKDAFELTRKHAIPLLEFFDRAKVTRRIGNERLILPDPVRGSGEASRSGD